MKRKLKENIFWVSIVASLVLLLILSAVFILPAISNKGELKEKINSEQNLLKVIVIGAQDYSNDAAGKLKKGRERLITDYNNVVDFYEGYDKALEKWFEGLKNPPDFGSFDAKYKDYQRKLDTVLRSQKLLKDERMPSLLNWSDEKPVDNSVVLKRIQKRYWVRERVVSGIVESLSKGLNIKSFKGINFTEKLDVPQGAPGEYALPDESGETITFEITVDILYGDTLKFISYLINPDIKPKLLIKVRSCKISMTEPMEEQKTIEYDAKEPSIEPNPVTLILRCEVIDFDSSRRRDFTQPQKTQ